MRARRSSCWIWLWLLLPVFVFASPLTGVFAEEEEPEAAEDDGVGLEPAEK